MLDELYQEVILDHNKSPRNYGVLDKYTCTSEGNNPLCGDRLTIYVSLNSDNVIENISFKARGCAISIASASIMSEVVKGKTVDEVRSLFDYFHKHPVQLHYKHIRVQHMLLLVGGLIIWAAHVQKF